MQISDIFKRNLEAMSGFEYNSLRKSLANIKELREFSYKIGKDELDINFIRKRNLKMIYNNPIKELENSLNCLKSYIKYPFLFFYGLGNGILYKAILQNAEHKRVIVFEKEIEIIFLTLNIIDFSQDLRQGRLIIIPTDEMNYAKADKILSLSNMSLFLRTYTLHIHSDFYKSYEKDIQKINDFNMQAIKNISLRKGNDPHDAMLGIEQLVYNLPKMLTHPSLGTLIKKRSKKGDTAIIVSTGPSLDKQLQILKKYSQNAAIFCADSSYSILYENDIKPDYVLSLERVPLTSEFFNTEVREFDKDILFILAALTHPNSLKYLENSKKNYMLIPRYLSFSLSLKLTPYHFIGGGMSVANMAYELAALLQYKNIVLIGQDLAYSKEGISHSKNYINIDTHKDDFQQDQGYFITTAYGGEGTVESSQVWTLFRQIFENYISNNKNKINTYNCTEGGARIEGSIEMPFKEFCKKNLCKGLKKPFTKLKKPSRQESNQFMLQAYAIIKKELSLSDTFVKKAKKIRNQILNLRTNKSKYTLNEINQALDDFKEKLNSKRYSFLYEILGPTLHHEENIIAPLYVANITNDGEKQNKLVAWLYAHESLLETIIDLVLVQKERLKKAILPLQDELERRKLI
ncbi:motility associated factor glycosyltransferase family protein [Campylobacter coli]|nr:motility associated factor glycosyltransferase family protein [Campylobacter coli]